MATKELRELRHKYKAAYTTYMSCVQALADATERGEWAKYSNDRARERRVYRSGANTVRVIGEAAGAQRESPHRNLARFLSGLLFALGLFLGLRLDLGMRLRRHLPEPL